MGGRRHFFHDSDVALIIGNNPLVSHYAPPGSVPSMSPSAQLRKAKQRGLKLIVVDPRETELAREADLFLQVQPGQDAVLVGGMIRLILEEDLHDQAFCKEYVEGLETLRQEVAEFTLDRVEALTGIRNVGCGGQNVCCGPSWRSRHRDSARNGSHRI